MTERNERYEWMDMPKANKECPRRDQIIFETCPECMSKVGLHCIECKIQVTGCLCTEVDRFGENEAVKRIFDRLGEAEARIRLAEAGIMIPKGFGSSN